MERNRRRKVERESRWQRVTPRHLRDEEYDNVHSADWGLPRAEICTGILNGAYGATPAANCISSTALATKLGSLCTAR
eukprot:3682434-Rhodomonas_salina.2